MNDFFMLDPKQVVAHERCTVIRLLVQCSDCESLDDVCEVSVYVLFVLLLFFNTLSNFSLPKFVLVHLN